MGFFDFLKKKTPLPPTPPLEEQKPARKAPKKKKQPGGSTARVPEGHEVIVHHAMSEPSVIRTQGGLVLASFGVAGDDQDGELDAILREIGAMLDTPAAPAHLVNVNRDLQVSELFAPADPAVLRFQSPLSWIFHQGSVESLTADPRRLRSVLRAMYEIATREGTPIPQAAYLVDGPSPRTLPFVRLVLGLGLTVKMPDDQEGGLAVLLEVKRPEGPILCVLAGKAYPGDNVADPYARTVNEEKDRAISAGHDGVVIRLQEQELAGLVERVGSAEGKPQLALRAPRLRQIILDLESSAGKGGMEAILSELLSRSASLLFMKNPHDRGIEVRNYGAAGRALPMFSDLRCLEWAARDLGKEPGSFEVASIPPRQLIAMAADGELGIAICTYRDRKMPVYAILPGPLVKSVAAELQKS